MNKGCSYFGIILVLMGCLLIFWGVNYGNSITGRAVDEFGNNYLAFKFDFENGFNDSANGIEAIGPTGFPTIVNVDSGKAMRSMDSSPYGSFRIPYENTDLDEYTFMAWVKFDKLNFKEDNLNRWDGFYGQYSTSIGFNGDGKLQHYLWDGNYHTTVGTTILEKDKWYHLAVSAKDNGKSRVYLNGNLETEDNLSIIWKDGVFFSNYYNGYDGYLDDLRFYERQLSSEKIMQIANAGRPGSSETQGSSGSQESNSQQEESSSEVQQSQASQTQLESVEQVTQTTPTSQDSSNVQGDSLRLSPEIESNTLQTDSCQNGCLVEGNCLNQGSRINKMYCSFNGLLISQKGDGALCENNYECFSNECRTGSCVNTFVGVKEQAGFMKKILCRLTSLPVLGGNEEDFEKCLVQ